MRHAGHRGSYTCDAIDRGEGCGQPGLNGRLNSQLRHTHLHQHVGGQRFKDGGQRGAARLQKHTP